MAGLSAESSILVAVVAHIAPLGQAGDVMGGSVGCTTQEFIISNLNLSLATQQLGANIEIGSNLSSSRLSMLLTVHMPT